MDNMGPSFMLKWILEEWMKHYIDTADDLWRCITSIFSVDK